MSGSSDFGGGGGRGGGGNRGRFTQRVPQHDSYPDFDPRTGEAWPSDSYTQDPRTQTPPTFEFQPSPLRPRGQASADPYAAALDAALEPYVTEPPQQRTQIPRQSQLPPMPSLDHRDQRPPELSAQHRATVIGKERNHAPIVPAGSVTGKSLTLVIAIMCFLACLTVGAVYLMNRSASAWMRDISSEVTVQVEAREKVDVERQVREVSQYLQKQPGVRGVKPLSFEASASLLEPWLGNSDALKSLPVPRLIAIEVDQEAPPNFTALRTQLGQQFKGATLDDHRHWQQQIRTVVRSFGLGGLAILALVAAATMAIIISATRSALAANREIVEVLHFVGATDKFIAREFEKHFLRLGVKAGVFGAVLAALTFLLLPFVMELLGGGTVTLTELQRMIGAGALDAMGYGFLALSVVVIAAICMLTSRIGVYRILHSQH
ncbi:MAG: ABC transporter permease [Hyphomicrobiaceae bacterium]